MARKRPTIEEQLLSLKQTADDGSPGELTAAVQQALAANSNLIVEQAAKLVPERELTVSEDLLRSAFDRFLRDASETDNGCRAKLPLVEALVHLEHDDPDFYQQGMKYVQLDPVWGQRADSAGNVRGACAFGLIRSRMASPAATMLALVDLLNDSDKLARMHAAKAIGLVGSSATVPVLRLKALAGDPEFEVVGECFRAILNHDAADNIEFVSRYMAGEPDVAIEAAASLGECRNAAAVQAVISATQHCSSQLLDAFYISIGLSRLPQAIDFLVDQIEANSTNACRAVKALAPTRFYPELSERVAAAVTLGGDHGVEAVFRECFPT